MERDLKAIGNKVKELKKVVRAVSLSKGGPFYQFDEKVKENFRLPEKATTVLTELQKGSSTKEIGEKLDVSPRAVRNKLNKMNELAGEFFEMPLTEGIPRKGHVLTEIGDLYAEYLLNNTNGEEK